MSCSGMKRFPGLSCWEETDCSRPPREVVEDVLPSEAREMGLRSDTNLNLRPGLWEDTQFAGNTLFSNWCMWNSEQI